MNKKEDRWRNHSLLIICTAVVLLLFGRLYQNLQPHLIQTEQLYKNGRALNLKARIDIDSLRSILTTGNYFSDNRDIELIVDSLPSRLAAAGQIPNLGALNKQAFFISAPVRWQSAIGGSDFSDRFHASLLKLGFDSALYSQELASPLSHEPVITSGNGSITISGTVTINGQAAPNLLVQLKNHIVSAWEDTAADILSYCRTNNLGYFAFNGLQKDSGYSVLPLKPGFEFGSIKTGDWGSPAHSV